MSMFTLKMEKFAQNSNLKIEIEHNHFVYLTLPRRFVLGVGMLDPEYTEFKINCTSDYNSPNEIPEQLSVYFMSRNNPTKIGNWVIEFGESSQKYWHALHFVVLWSSLTQERFDQIVNALEDEFLSYAKFVSGF